jgi:hypothetical protein
MVCSGGGPSVCCSRSMVSRWAFNVSAVGAVLGHGLSSSESPAHRGSIPTLSSRLNSVDLGPETPPTSRPRLSTC